MDSNFLVQSLAKKKAQEANQAVEADNAEKQFTIDQVSTIVQSLGTATAILTKFLEDATLKASVDNFPDTVKTPDVKEVVDAVKGLEKTLKPARVDNSDVIKAISELNKSIAAIPAAMPRTEAVTVTNLGDVAKSLQASQAELTKALKGLELSPKITVPKPEVTVQPTNVAGVIKELKNVAKEIVEKPITPVSVTPTDPLVRFTPAHVDDAGMVQYFGFIATDGEWFIRKYDTSVSPKTLTFKFGTGGASAYNTAFTNRASLTYTMWTT